MAYKNSSLYKKLIEVRNMENNLLKKLDLETAEEFRFFEDFADLIEDDEELDEDEVYELFSNVDKEIVDEIINSYMDEIIEAYEDKDSELYTTLELIKNNLTRLFREDGGIREFSEELIKFKEWFSISENVELEEIETGKVKFVTLVDSLSHIRMEKMETTKYRYDFSGCLDYSIDEYVVPLDLFMDRSEEEDYEDEE